MRISVIIPALNEEAALPLTLARLMSEKPHEIIVVDGGSTDGTVPIAEQRGVRVVLGSRGRASQMNAGAAAATGDAFLFLHADCSLQPGSIVAAQRSLARRGVSAGCFKMHVPLPHPLYRSIAWCATARVRLFGIAYGDQGIFVRRDIFQRVGGFPQLKLMEDVWFSLKLRRVGRITVADRRIDVSPRRWQSQGIIRQTIRNWLLTALAAVGVHPNRLARMYPHVR
jgi:rSAM/selenodomain-associated transferase 2